MFGMELDEYEGTSPSLLLEKYVADAVHVAKFYSKRFETIPWDIDRVAEPEGNVKKEPKKKKSFAQRFKGDVNKYTIGMMGLEMEMRLRVEEKSVRVD